MEEPLPANSKIPIVKGSSGVENPHEHIMAYAAAIMPLEVTTQ